MSLHDAIPTLRAAGLLASPGGAPDLVLVQDGRGVAVELRIAVPPPRDLVERVWAILGRVER